MAIEAYWISIKDGEMTIAKADATTVRAGKMPFSNVGQIAPSQFEYYPRVAWVPPRKHAPTPWLGCYGWVVSAEVKEIIEALEPGVHQFIPLTVKSGTRANHVDYQYYSLRINQRIDDVLVEKSDVKWQTTEFKGNVVRAWLKKTAPLVLPASSIRGKHLWWNKACALPLILISGELYRALVERKLTKGLRIQQQIVD